MTTRAREIAFLRKVEDRGAKVDWAALDREFNFTVSGYVSFNVDMSPFDRIREIVNNAVEKKKFKCELSGIVFFPTILDTALVRPRSDFVTHKRSTNGYFVGKNIDFRLWQKAGVAKRISLAANNLILSIQAIPPRHLSTENQDSLITMIGAAQTKLKSRYKR